MQNVLFIIIFFLFPILLTFDHHFKLLPESKRKMSFKVWKGVYYCVSAVLILIYTLTGYELINNTAMGFTITIAIFEGLPLLLNEISNAGKPKEQQNI